MALFPFFVNIEGARGLIIGTGKHAEEKIQRLQPYGPCLTIIPEGKFKESDLEPVPAFVIAAGVLLKQKIEEQIPENMEEILNFLQEVRPVIAKTLTDKKQRYTFYYKLAEICMAEHRVLKEEEFRRRLLWHAQSVKKN